MAENQVRSTKVRNEKSILEAQTSKATGTVMSHHVYSQIRDKINHIRGLCDKKRAKGSNQADPTTQLIEIETHINRVRNFLVLAKKADYMMGETIVKDKMRVLYNRRKDEKFAAMQLEKKQIQEENARKLQERKSKKLKPTGVRIKQTRSEKPQMKKQEVTKQVMTSEEVDILKYLDMTFEGEQKK